MASYEHLDVWKRTRLLAVDVCRTFRSCKDFAFLNQITRSAISVPSNIAEGAERNSKAEFAQFLGYAKGSMAELRTQLMIGRDLEYLSAEDAERMLDESLQLSRMLYRLYLAQK